MSNNDKPRPYLHGWVKGRLGRPYENNYGHPSDAYDFEHGYDDGLDFRMRYGSELQRSKPRPKAAR